MRASSAEYKTIFGVPAWELYVGGYQKVDETILETARFLAGKIKTLRSDRLIAEVGELKRQ